MRRVIIGLVTLSCVAAAQDARPIDEVVAELKEAFKGKDETVIEPVIRDAGSIENDDVSEQIALGIITIPVHRCPSCVPAIAHRRI